MSAIKTALLMFFALLGEDTAKTALIKKLIVACFDDVKWTKHSFSVNSGPLWKVGSGETRFYEATEIDAAITKLNAVLARFGEQKEQP